MVVMPRRSRVSNFSKKAQRNRQHVRAVMEAAEPRVLLTSYTVVPVASFDTTTALGGDIKDGLVNVGGNLYGTTNVANNTDDTSVFEIKSGSTTPTVLETFTGNGSNERDDMSPLISDGQGHLFGTTHAGGGPEEGTVYEIDTTQATPTVTVIATFDGSAEGGIEGEDPQGALAFDSSGNLYGETKEGGANGDGSIYEIANPTGGSPAIQTIASFDDTTNGSAPDLGVVYYSGALYGANNDGPSGASPEIYKYNIGTQALTEQVSLAGDDNIAGGSLNPVIVDSNGNLFVTSNSGVSGNEDGGIFEVAPGATTYTTVATFNGSNGGPNGPVGPLTIGPDGNFYGTASSGGTTNGDIFEVDATSHAITSLGILDGSTEGSDPNGGLVFVNNNIYGTTSSGGSDGGGSVFELTAAGPPAKLVITTEPTSQTASNALSGSIVVQVEDANGDLITNDTSNVTLSVATPTGTAFGADSTTTVAAVGGIATFNNLVLNKAGMYTLSATDTDSGTVLTPATSTSFSITHATATQLAFATQPSSAAENANFGPVVVDIEDTYGNLVTNNTSAVTLGISSGGPAGESITGTATTAAIGGVATFNDLSLADAGNYKLSATDSSLTGAVSSQFAITGAFGSAAKLVFATQPINITAGQSESGITVDVEDASGNLVVTDNSTVTLAIATGPNSGTTLATANVVNGVATLAFTLDTAGTYTLSATDSSLTSATSNPFTVSPVSTANSINVTNTPTVTAGNPTTVDTALEDQYGNVETSDNASQVILNVINPDGTTTQLGPVTVQNGVATFSLSLANPGAYSFNASSDSLTTVVNSSSSTTLTYSAPTLVFAQPIGTVVAGKKLAPFNITLYNASGVVTNAKTKVTLAVLSGPTGGRVYGSVHANMKNGTVTFKNIYFKVAGMYQLAANAPTYATAKSTQFEVIPAAPKKLTFTQQPTPNPVAPSTAFSTDVKLVDAYGNGISDSDVVLSLKSEPKGASALAGVLSEETVSGVADFTGLTLTTPGNYTLEATIGKLKATSKKFVVS